MPGSPGSARAVFAAARFDDVGFAGVGSAPSPTAKAKQAKQKNRKRDPVISGMVAKVNAYLAEAARYTRQTRRASKKSDLTFSQLLQLRDERGGAVGKVAIIPPELLSVSIEHDNCGKPYNRVLLRKFAVLPFEFRALRFASGEVEFYDHKIVAREVFELWLQQDLFVELFAPATPI